MKNNSENRDLKDVPTSHQENLSIPKNDEYAIKGSEKGGRYLYGDYSDFDENRNVINLINDYSATSRNVFLIHRNVQDLDLLVEETYKFQKEMQNKFIEFSKITESAIYDFYSKHHTKVLKTLNEKPDGIKIFFDTKNIVTDSFKNIEKDYTENLKRYQNYIVSKIQDYQKNSIMLLQTWLSKGAVNLPYSIISKITTIIELNLMEANYGSSSYKIITTNSIPISEKGDNILQPKKLIYTFSTDGKSIDFFAKRKKLNEFIKSSKDLTIPVGYKVSISEKLRKSLRLGSGVEEKMNNNKGSSREPELIVVDNHFVTYLQYEKNKKLLLRLSSESSYESERFIEFDYDLTNEIFLSNYDKVLDTQAIKKFISENKGVNINYRHNHDGKIINSRIVEFFNLVDIKQIFEICKFFIKVIEKELDPLDMKQNAKLEYIEFDDKKAIDNHFDEDTKEERIFYNESLVVYVLELIASEIEPLIKKIRAKSPIEGELILRHEVKNEPRKEYVTKDSDLIQQLNEFEEGKKILRILDINQQQ